MSLCGDGRLTRPSGAKVQPLRITTEMSLSSCIYRCLSGWNYLRIIPRSRPFGGACRLAF